MPSCGRETLVSNISRFPIKVEIFFNKKEVKGNPVVEITFNEEEFNFL